MNFGLSDEDRAVFEMAQRFGSERIAPFARDWESEGTIPRALWTELAELGLGGVYVPEEMGGAGLSRLSGTMIFEALSMACPSVAAFLSIHNMCAAMIAREASDAVRTRVLPHVLAMDCVLSYCLTEPGAGSDAAALRTRARTDGTGYVIDGSKAFISGGGYSDAYVVMARTGGDGAAGISAFLVEAGCDGLSFGALEDKMGWRAQPTRSVHFDAVRVGADALLGVEGHGFRYAMQALDGGRLNIAACALGAAQAAMDAARGYTGERTAFGRKLDQFQALQFKLADMEIALQSARVFLRQAAWMLDQRDPQATRHCAMAKAFVTERACEVVDTALQLHGGYGYLADYGIEKLARDLRVHRILEGTNEIMRLIIARDLLEGSRG